MDFAIRQVFSVACQIFFSDPDKVREETGLTETWWQGGAIRVRHRNDSEIRGLFPCAYGGGGSCAFDRKKFLELGGFDELLAPFYMEDTDLGYLAWKRGWKNLYQPASVVFTNIAEPSGNGSVPLTSKACCKRIFFCSPGRTSTNGGGSVRISSLPGWAPYLPGWPANRRSAAVLRACYVR